MFSHSRVLVFSRSHVLTFSRSHVLTFSRSHVLTFSRSHVLTFSRSHVLTFSRSHVLTFSRSHVLTFSRSHVLTFSCSCVPAGEDGSDSPAETAGSQAGGGPSQCQSCACTALRVLGSLLVVLSISSSWVGTTQVMKLTFQSFSCPFFMTWFSTNWNILFFPIYYSGHLVTGSPKQTPIQKFRWVPLSWRVFNPEPNPNPNPNPSSPLPPRECSRIFGEDGLTLKLFVKRTAPFSILWTLTNYLYLLALRKLSATDVSALYCCHKAFVFLLSWIVLKDRFMGIRVRGEG
ncbi:UNVERIFIED_CONTAM: hypothetical protein FKN15_039312 [Acipenser sinensis]